MPIAGISDFASSAEGDEGVKGESLPPFGPGGIYHEKQIGSLCAVHCVNNLLQGPLFEVMQFQAVAMELDRAEQRLTSGEGLDYGNARLDGFYNVQVMQAVLGRAGYDMQPIKGEAGKSAQADTAKETAFILNKREHWFALRRIGREWFDLNSCLRTPRHYTDGDIRFHIGDAVREGYMVFVVRGEFPRCALEEDSTKLVEAVQGCGRPGQGYSLFAGAGQRLDASSSTPGSAQPSATSAPASNDADALRRARLARFGGGGGAPAQTSTTVSSQQPTTTPAAAPAAQPAAPPTYTGNSEPKHKEALETLLAMGFARDGAVRALEAANGNAQQAAEILLAC